MNYDAICHMIRVLQQVQDDATLISAFDLDHWVDSDLNMCACGFAARDPWFIQHGFRSETVDSVSTIVYDVQGTSIYGWHAVKEFFGLDAITIQELFMDGFYSQPVTPSKVIARLKKVIAGTWDGNWD